MDLPFDALGGSRPFLGVSKDPMWPIVPPRSIYGGFGWSFWRSFRIQNLSNLLSHLDMFSVVFLGMFWQIYWCQNDDEKAKGGFVEIFVLRK